MNDDRTFPYEEGDTTVLGPEIFASDDGQVICWQGRNFVPQERVERALREQIPGAEAIVIVDKERSMLLVPDGDGLMSVDATIKTTYAEPPAPPLTVTSVTATVNQRVGEPA